MGLIGSTGCAAATTAALLAAASGVGAAGVNLRPATLVLQQRDLGRAFSGRGARIDNAAAAVGAPAGFAARLALWRRLGGYQAQFTRTAEPATLQDGPLAITSSASVYADAAGAQAAFAYAAKRLVPAGYVPLALGFAIGEQARQWVRQDASGLGAMLQYTLIWRERNVDAAIVVSGRFGVVSAADLAPLARRQDSRIRAQIR